MQKSTKYYKTNAKNHKNMPKTDAKTLLLTPLGPLNHPPKEPPGWQRLRSLDRSFGRRSQAPRRPQRCEGKNRFGLGALILLWGFLHLLGYINFFLNMILFFGVIIAVKPKSLWIRILFVPVLDCDISFECWPSFFGSWSYHTHWARPLVWFLFGIDWRYFELASDWNLSTKPAKLRLAKNHCTQTLSKTMKHRKKSEQNIKYTKDINTW